MKKAKIKSGLVVGLFPEQYEIKDFRLKKPVCHQKFEKPNKEGAVFFNSDSFISAIRNI